MLSRVPTVIQLRKHLERVRACTSCPDVVGPVVTGPPIVSPVMLIGQAPGPHEAKFDRPFAWTAGKTMFQWLASIGLPEQAVRDRVFISAVARCFPGKAGSGGDRVPDAGEIERCSRHLHAEVRMLKPRLVIPVGKLAIAQLDPDVDKLADVIGSARRATLAGCTFDAIALPHPSGASTWHRTEPGKRLLGKALALIENHEAWRSLVRESAA